MDDDDYIPETCPRCHGQGQMIADPCTTCHGHGQVRKTRTLNLKIPAGVDDGSRIRLSGEGDAGQRGGPRGDLYVFISVTPHDLFERDNLDLLVTVPVPMTVAALAVALAGSALGAGCGQKGPLYLPPKTPVNADTPAPAAPAVTPPVAPGPSSPPPPHAKATWRCCA